MENPQLETLRCKCGQTTLIPGPLSPEATFTCAKCAGDKSGPYADKYATEFDAMDEYEISIPYEKIIGEILGHDAALSIADAEEVDPYERNETVGDK